MTEEEIKAKQFALKSHKAQEEKQEKAKARQRAKAQGEKFDEEAYDKEERSAGRPDNAVIAGDASQAKKEGTDSISKNERTIVNLDDSTSVADIRSQVQSRILLHNG